MKAFILAAGLGTRLRSLGLDVPKVMVPIGGKPLLEHHLELFKRQGIHEFIVNLHYLPEKITDYFGDGSKFGVSITYSHEPELLGTAGAVKKMETDLRGGSFIVFYGDNLVRVDFAPLVEFHRVASGRWRRWRCLPHLNRGRAGWWRRIRTAGCFDLSKNPTENRFRQI